MNEARKPHELDPDRMNVIRQMVSNHGLRPVVNAVAAGAKELVEDGQVIKDEFGGVAQTGVNDFNTAAIGVAAKNRTAARIAMGVAIGRRHVVAPVADRPVDFAVRPDR